MHKPAVLCRMMSHVPAACSCSLLLLTPAFLPWCVCVCACMCACVRACVCACMRASAAPCLPRARLPRLDLAAFCCVRILVRVGRQVLRRWILDVAVRWHARVHPGADMAPTGRVLQGRVCACEWCECAAVHVGMCVCVCEACASCTVCLRTPAARVQVCNLASWLLCAWRADVVAEAQAIAHSAPDKGICIEVRSHQAALALKISGTVLNI